MSELDDLLQQRIAQWEAGEPLEACLDGLPAQEKQALRLIAALRTVPVDDAADESILAQRADVLTAAAARLNGAPAPAPPPETASDFTFFTFLLPVRAWLDRLLSRRELAVGLASLLIVALLGAAWMGLNLRQSPNDAEIVAPAGDAPETAGDEIASPPTALGENDDETDTAVTDAAGDSGHIIYIPSVANPLILNAQTAAVENVAGLVEIQDTDGTWTAVNRSDTIAAGQRVRTGALSQATLTFYDGSQAQLHANTELSIDALDAQRPEEGLRTVVLTQHVGESDHSVQFRNDGGSRYEVKTPAGDGIARGTKFRVLVTPGLLARFVVTEGKVDVTGLSRTVPVVAGQLTTVIAGSVPDEPTFRITGEGEVTQIGAAWTIAGQTFQTSDQTIIVGNPQVGDLVFVEGRLLADGSRLADRIILLRRAVTNRFTLTGAVEAINAATWTVAGQTVLINEETEVADDIIVGENVRVAGVILPGGSLLATRIELVADDNLPGLPFSFNGIVQVIGDDAWTISDIVIAVDEETRLGSDDDDDDSSIVVGDVVAVSGWILPDGTWLADRIELVDDDDDLPQFTISGRVQSIDPWRVADIAFETREWTAVEPGIAVGDLVRVNGRILEDGTRIATSIEALHDDDDDDQDTIVIIGIVGSIDPWIVNGLPFLVTNNTTIIGDISVGTPVVVEVRLLLDGTWQVVSIRPLYPRFGLGCFVINTVVIGVQPNQLTLQNWPTITLDSDDDIDIEGDIKVDSIITLPICIQFDGTIITIGNIIVIYQPVVIIAPPAPAPPSPPRGGGNGNNNHNGDD